LESSPFQRGFDGGNARPISPFAIAPSRASVKACRITSADRKSADVILHALTDALLGAIAKGDIGRAFPPSNPRWKGEDSKTLLAHALELLKQENAIVSNIDIVVVGEAPKIAF
jgi:2-C-methyl-D-erythritol 2,4-cyclodiphosphate synthase